MPVVREDTGVDEVAVGVELGDRLLRCPENRGGAVVADEHVAGRVERDARDAGKVQAENDSRLELHQARTQRPDASSAARPASAGV